MAQWIKHLSGNTEPSALSSRGLSDDGVGSHLKNTVLTLDESLILGFRRLQKHYYQLFRVGCKIISSTWIRLLYTVAKRKIQ